MLARLSNSAITRERPSCDVERTLLIPLSELTISSTGAVTVFSTLSADAPPQLV